MPAPKTLAGQAVLRELTDLNKSLKFRLGDFKALRQLRAAINEQEALKKSFNALRSGLTNSSRQTLADKKLAADLQARIKELQGKTGGLDKEIKSSSKILDALKRGAFKEINPSWGAKFGSFLAILNAGATTFLIKKNEEIQEANIEAQKITEAGLANTFTRTINNSIEIKTLQKQSEGFKKFQNDITYEVREGRRKVEEKVDVAKKQANDALYETREGRKKLETQINEQNSNFRSLKTDFDKALKNLNTGFQSQVTKTITEIQSNLKSADNQIKSANEKISIQGKIITDLQTGFKTVQGLPKTIDTKIAELKEFTIKLVNGKLQPVETEQKKITQQISTIQKNGVTRTDIEAANASLRKTYEQSFEYKAQQWQQEIQKQNENFWNKKTDVTLSTTTKTTQSNTEKIAQLERDNTKIKTDLDKIDKQIKEQTKVNQEAIPKLNSILNLIPLIPARVADNIRPSIPTLPQIENATGTAVCKSLNGGCAGRALNDAVNNVKGNANNNTGNILNAINTGANAALLQGQGEILNRLGPQLPGGLSSTFGRLWQTLQIDRIMNVLILITTMHNALMLSNNIAQTLFGVFDNIGQAAGFKWQNEKGEEVGFGGLVGQWTTSFFTTIFGQELYSELTLSWKKASRIYQSTANTIASLTNASDVILNGVQLVAGQSAKIGNALRNFRAVGERAYETFNPQPNLKWGIFNKLNNLQESADFILQVSQIPVDLTQAASDFTQNATELAKAIKEDPEVPPGTAIQNAEQTLAKEATSKLASVAAGLTEIDLEADE